MSIFCSNRRPTSIASSLALCMLIPALFSLGACPRAEEEVAEDRKEEAPDAEGGSGHLKVTAFYAEGGPEVDDARFTIETAEGKRVLGPSTRSGFDIEAGSYRVTARVDSAQATAEATVRPGERTELNVVLDAGILEIQALLVDDGPAAEDVRFRILSAKKDIRGDRESIYGPGRRSSFVLPKGTYVARATEDQASAEIEVTVEAGERTEEKISLNAGLLFASLSTDDSDVPDSLRWTILSAEEDLRGQRETITGPTRRDKYVLPAGKYLLQARAEGRVAQQEVEIQAGERLDVEISMPAPDEETEGD